MPAGKTWLVVAHVDNTVPQAVHVEHMIAGQLLVAAGGSHVLTTDDADTVSLQVCLCCIPETLIHVGTDAAVSQEVDHPVAEIAEGPIQVSHLCKTMKRFDCP